MDTVLLYSDLIKAEVFENDYVTSSISYLEFSSLTAHAGLTTQGRWSKGTKTLQVLVNAHAPIKDGTVFAWTGKTDSKTQRVDADLFETGGGESSPFLD